MRPPIFILATALVMPTVSVAQSLDIPDDSTLPLSETDENISKAPPDAEDLDGQIGSTDPIVVEPKFDLMAEQPDDLGDTSNLDHTDPEPAPGLVIKIPAN